MSRIGLVSLLLAAVLALFAFNLVASAFAEIAEMLFWVLAIIGLGSLVLSWIRRSREETI